jgi:hypothetical protein
MIMSRHLIPLFSGAVSLLAICRYGDMTVVDSGLLEGHSGGNGQQRKQKQMLHGRTSASYCTPGTPPSQTSAFNSMVWKR